MSEPVAYYKDFSDGTKLFFKNNELCDIDNSDNLIKPLYTAEQLCPRVKMTPKEFEEWKDLYSGSVLFSEAIEIIDLDEGHNYENISKKIWVKNRKNNIKNEAMFARLYADFDPDNPDGTIEIVPDIRWFVRSKEQYKPDMDQGISESGYLYLMQGNFYKVDYYLPTPFKDDAQQFDTKEEAERWINPLTEAVLLPVEDE